MPSIFLSYRRDDSPYVAATIANHLEKAFGENSVFMDVESIQFGLDFREQIEAAISQCDVLIALIGDSWLGVDTSTGIKRIDNEKDFVQIEIASALRRKIPIIPVLVENASMPAVTELPDSIKDLAYQPATEIRAGQTLNNHLKRLVGGLHKLFESQKEKEIPPRKKVVFKEKPDASKSKKENDAFKIKSSEEHSSVRRKESRVNSRKSAVNTDLAFMFLIMSIFSSVGIAFIVLETNQLEGMEIIYFILPFIFSIISAKVTRNTLLAPLTCFISPFIIWLIVHKSNVLIFIIYALMSIPSLWIAIYFRKND